MGQTLKVLAEKDVQGKTVFNNRFVVEVCEQVHVHYRNLRILMSMQDWFSMAEGMADSVKRWKAQGCPEIGSNTHVELCRKQVATCPVDDSKIKVNLNANLYDKHKGRIFSEGAGLDDPAYIHLKIRDLRLELTLDEFIELADSIAIARAKIGKEDCVAA